MILVVVLLNGVPPAMASPSLNSGAPAEVLQDLVVVQAVEYQEILEHTVEKLFKFPVLPVSADLWDVLAAHLIVAL